MAEMPLADHDKWSRQSSRIEPIALSQYPFWHGDRGATSISRSSLAASKGMPEPVEGCSMAISRPIVF